MDNNLIEQIRSSVDIVDVISRFIDLKRHGKNYMGICPFHDDHSPSMIVSPEKQIYKCFSCGAAGNVFTFVQNYDNVSFVESVKFCADIAGIDFAYKKKPQYNKYQTLYDIYALAQKFYQNNLYSTKGKEALKYLKDRHLSDDIIKEFQLGLSLGKSDMLTKLLKSKFSVDDMLKCGLVNEGDNDLYDVYRNRIMYPLCDVNGRVVGYNGRIYLDGDENASKYINPKETPIFKKSKLLFNYHRAKDIARKEKCVILVEGPMDVIRCYCAGVKNVVAALGTAFTNDQIMLLKKLSTNVILCFDGDKAGLNATNKAISELAKYDIVPRIVRLPDKLDPDEFIIKNGSDAFNKIINNPMNIMEYNEIIFKENMDLSNSDDLAKYTNLMIKEISKINDEILKEISINKLVEETKLDKDFIVSKLDKPKIEKQEVKQKKMVRLSKYEKSQQRLLFYMLKDKRVVKMYDKKITRMSVERYRHLAFQISFFVKQHGYIRIAELMSELNDDYESIKTIGEITSLNLKDEYSVEEIDDYLNNIKEYNEKNLAHKYQEDLKREIDLEKKLEIAKSAIAHKLRSEEND